MIITRLIVAIGLACVSLIPCVAQCTDHAALSESDRKGFVAAAYGRDAEVAVEFLSANGCGEKMLAGLGGFGAMVQYSDDKVGYALVTLERERVLDAVDLPGIADATLPRVYADSNLVPSVDGKISPIPSIEIPFPHAATILPASGPYFAATEAGLTDLWKRQPGADGRGVRVAVVDQGIDLLHPALEKALDTSGNLVPKIADIATVTEPDKNANWVRFGDPVEVTKGTFAAADRAWTAPSNGKYRFGIYERTLAFGPERNSHTKKLALRVGVLWNEQQGLVWVNTHGDGDFSKETPLKDYSESQDFAFFGTLSAGGDNRIPFGVKIDRERHAVYVAIANGGHGTFVAGPLAANRLTGGLFDGAAPNAQLIDEVSGSILVPSVLRALARPDVDVVNRSGGIGRYNDDGREGVERQVLERAVAVYDKPLVSYSAGKNLLLINDYVSPDMLRRNRQIGPPYLDAMNSFVWFGPEGDVNTVLGPSGSLVTLSRYMPIELPGADGRRSYDDKNFDSPAPAGYGIGSNNSPTIPIISGVLADLISQARQAHVRYSAPRLYQAITTSSRVVRGFPLSEQGYGVVNAEAAWNRLAKMATADDPSNPKLTSFKIERADGGIRKEVNGFVATTSNAGVVVDGELWITRDGGYAGGRVYRLALRANEGSFTLVDTKAKFVQGMAARVRFRAISRPKWNLAFLQLIDAKTDAVMEEVPLSIEAPDVPEVLGTGVERYEATTPPRHEEYGYVELGEDVEAARLTMKIPFDGGEGISGRRLPPNLRNAHDDATGPVGEPVDVVHHVGPLESLETLFANTKPGIQQFYWENRGSHAEYETQYDEPPAATVPITGTVTVTKYAVTISKKDEATLEVTNKLADVDGRLELYDAKVSSSDQKGDGAHASVDIPRELPAHLAQWRIDVTASSLPAESADIFLLNCTDPKSGCYVAAQQAIGKKDSPLVIDNPKDGNWRIVIRTREPIGKPVEYQVREALLTPTAHPLEASDSRHGSGATWTVALPAKQSDTQYAAFHIQGEPRPGVTQNNTAKNGLDIALTPLDGNAP